LLRYNALLAARDQLPVETALVLLRPPADGRALSGRLDGRRADRATGLLFDYTVVRLWEQPVTALLSGGLATLPLAPLAAAEPAALPDVVRQIATRLQQEAPPRAADELWVATYTLFGLRYSRERAEQSGASRSRDGGRHARRREGPRKNHDTRVAQGQRLHRGEHR
jgi:hypothetical protein